MTGADQVSWLNPSVDKSMVEFKSLRFVCMDLNNLLESSTNR